MARLPAVLSKKDASPVLESFDVIQQSVVSVGTSATALPATNLSYRKGIWIQNIHA